MATVSVVVPAYNAQKYLAETLGSIAGQTFADWELVVVDDGSTDGTAEIARGFVATNHRARLIQQENRGLAGARNRGFAEASGESRYFLFLDADDLLEPDALKTLLEASASASDAKAVFGQATYIDAEGQPLVMSTQPDGVRLRWSWHNGEPFLTTWDSLVDLPPTYQSFLYGSSIRTPGLVLIPRESLTETDPFDPYVHGVEDWDLWLRLSLAGRIAYTERAVLKYRVHAQNMSGRIDFMRLGELRMRKKLLETPTLSAEQRQQAVAGLSFHYFGRGRIPYVTAAKEFLERVAGNAAPEPAHNKIEPGSLDEMKRDLMALIALDCDAGLAKKALSFDAAGTVLTEAEREAIRRAAEKLAADEARLIRRQKLRAIALSWPLLPARRAYRFFWNLARRSGKPQARQEQ